jgi:enoyl-CoA hydratase/carnithine racemase
VTVARLIATVADGVGLIEIDHPERRNAMTAAMWRRMIGVLEQWHDDPDVRVVAVRGRGGVFCAGVDIDEVVDVLFDRPDGGLLSAATDALARMPRPTVAVVEGACIGGGWEIAAACDIRVAARSAVLGVTPARWGVVYPPSGVHRLVELAGAGVARHLLLTGDLVSGEHALRTGLVTMLVDDDELDATAAALTATLRRRSQLSMRATKELLALRTDPGAQRAAYERWAALSLTSGELAEGRAAFGRRRHPRFPWSGEP